VSELFSVQVNKIISDIDADIEKKISLACNRLFDAIRDRTPVRTGRAKYSWVISDTYSADIVPEGDYLSAIQRYSGSDFKFEIDSVTGVVYIYNNLEYISFLEAGGSKQAPSGMIAISMAEFGVYISQ